MKSSPNLVLACPSGLIIEHTLRFNRNHLQSQRWKAHAVRLINKQLLPLFRLENTVNACPLNEGGTAGASHPNVDGTLSANHPKEDRTVGAKENGTINANFLNVDCPLCISQPNKGSAVGTIHSHMDGAFSANCSNVDGTLNTSHLIESRTVGTKHSNENGTSNAKFSDINGPVCIIQSNKGYTVGAIHLNEDGKFSAKYPNDDGTVGAHHTDEDGLISKVENVETPAVSPGVLQHRHNERSANSNRAQLPQSWMFTLSLFRKKHPPPRKKHLRMLTKFVPSSLDSGWKLVAATLAERLILHYINNKNKHELYCM